MTRLDFHMTANLHHFAIDKMLLENAKNNTLMSNMDIHVVSQTFKNSFSLLEKTTLADPLDSYDDLFNMHFENFHLTENMPVINAYSKHYSNDSIEDLNSYLML